MEKESLLRQAFKFWKWMPVSYVESQPWKKHLNMSGMNFEGKFKNSWKYQI